MLAVMGARSGSKSIPNKNIKLLKGRPLFTWAADAAKGSKHISRFVFSTDSEEYADLARSYQIEVPFLRPENLAGDSVPDFDYLHHAATWLEAQEGWYADIIVRVPATSPLCTSAHIDRCIELLIEDQEADSARTITKAGKHPYKLWRKDGDVIVPFLPTSITGDKDAHNLPRQSFPEAYQHVDVIALRWSTLVEKREMAGDRIRYVEIPREESVDIDTETDFILAEFLLEKRNK